MAARLRMALLGLWAGGMLASGLIFVPAAFGNLPTQLAAALLGDSFVWLDRAGMVFGSAAALLGCAALWQRERSSAIAWSLALLPLMGVLCHAIAYGWVSPEIRGLRIEGGGSVGGLSPEAAGFARFGRLHAISQLLFWLAALTALLSLAFDLPGGRSKTPGFSARDVENA